MGNEIYYFLKHFYPSQDRNSYSISYENVLLFYEAFRDTQTSFPLN